MQQGELDCEEVVDDVQGLRWGDLRLWVGGQSLDLDVVLLGVGMDPVEGGFAEGGQGPAQAESVLQNQ